ncbi:MAG: Ig-like domain-containing protein [Longimicrobiales bacterium]
MKIRTPAASLAPITAVALALFGCTDTTVQLVEIDEVRVIPERVEAVVSEQSALTTELRDREGNLLPDRAVNWASLDPGVVTVDSTGVLTAVAEGQALVTATAEGALGSALVVVQAQPGPIGPQPGDAEIEVSDDDLEFRVIQNLAKLPDAKSVRITNDESGTLSGLGVRVSYTGIPGWLWMHLSRDQAPATLQLRPTRSNLPLGRHYATVTITSSNGGSETVQVTYRVREP